MKRCIECKYCIANISGTHAFCSVIHSLVKINFATICSKFVNTNQGVYIAIVRMFNCMVIGGFNDYQFKTSCSRMDFEKKLHKKYGTNNKIISFKFVPIADIPGGTYLEL